ncbi:MAG: class II aldolase/adducin family protein [Chlorobi bacterium]|nr:class II aldolase/adducin family protein [Chlorobiota bacterium]
MSYEGVKYNTEYISEIVPADNRIDELRKWCRIFHEKELAPHYPGGTHGNMSFRVNPEKDIFIITAARTSFAEELSPEAFFTVTAVDLKNAVVYVSGSKTREPSSETLLHFAIYRERSDVMAILHGHCKTITQHAEKLGIVTTKEFVEPGTVKVVDSVLEVLDNHHFIEMKGHGFLSLGKSINEAGLLAMEMLKKV